MIKFQSYLAGSAFALLLAAHIAMELLNVYPANQYLWHVNIVFAREARPLLQHIDVLAGGSSAVSILALGSLALICILSARANMRLLAAVNCHIALIMMVHLAARSYFRTYPHGLPANDTLVTLGTDLSVVQFGMVAFILALSVACVLSHVEILGRGFSFPRRRSAVPVRREFASNTLETQAAFKADLRPSLAKTMQPQEQRARAVVHTIGLLARQMQVQRAKVGHHAQPTSPPPAR